MTTTQDRGTGLPIVGADAPKSKSVSIDPALMDELRTLEDKMNRTDAIASQLGVGIVIAIASAAAVGPSVVKNRQEWKDYVTKIAGLMGVAMEDVLETDLDKGLLLLK